MSARPKTPTSSSTQSPWACSPWSSAASTLQTALPCAQGASMCGRSALLPRTRRALAWNASPRGGTGIPLVYATSVRFFRLLPPALTSDIQTFNSIFYSDRTFSSISRRIGTRLTLTLPRKTSSSGTCFHPDSSPPNPPSPSRLIRRHHEAGSSSPYRNSAYPTQQPRRVPMIKQTYSVWVNLGNSLKKWHMSTFPNPTLVV